MRKEKTEAGNVLHSASLPPKKGAKAERTHSCFASRFGASDGSYVNRRWYLNGSLSYANWYPTICLASSNFPFFETAPNVQQIKLFKGVDNDLPELERQINRWIRKTGVQVLSISGNLSGQPGAGTGPMNSFAASDVLIVVTVETEKPLG